jgi:predicted RecB family nuclease
MPKRLSASRLNSFLGCAHSAALWLDDVHPPEHVDPGLELVRDKGFEHEAEVLARLEAEHGPAVAVPGEGPLQGRAEITADAMTAGAPLIYQAALFDERWVGYPDFLVRGQRDESGAWTYAAEDAKLARKAKPEHLIQLGVYRHLLEERGGAASRMGAIHVAAGEPERFDLAQTQHITARFMRQFEAFADQQDRTTRALPSRACAQCAYKPRCEAEWREADSPAFVAGLRTDQLLKLEKAGIATLGQLAGLEPTIRVAGIGAETLPKLVAQARLQKAAAVSGTHAVELLPLEPGRGFALLPRPAAGDLFFDMEGYPHVPDGLEYLFGIYGPVASNGEDAFRGLWGHDRAEEKAAFQALMDFLAAHLLRYPDAHIYHYAAYEPVALKKLASRHATREHELDQLLREHRLVDLYRVVKQSLRASTEGYSLKQLEKIYWGKREGEVTNAGDSIVEYERWRVSGEQAILDAIERYNEDDCVSTAKMRDWLEGLRPAGAAVTAVAVAEDDDTAERRERREAFQREREELARRVKASSLTTPEVRELIAEMQWFHERAQKPQKWSLFDRQTWTDEELIDDLDGLGGLVLDEVTAALAPARSFVATYRFPPQDTKMRVGQQVLFAGDLVRAGSIEALDPVRGMIVLKRGVKGGDFPERCGLSPNWPISQDGLVKAMMAFASRLAAGNDQRDRALLDLLLRRNPRLAGRDPNSGILSANEDLVAGTIRAIRDLDHTTLFIQGPPGTGKTYTSSHAIVDLLQAGKRVAVSSNSHKAINNLLAAVEKRAAETGFAFQGAKKASRNDPESALRGELIDDVYESGDVKPFHRLVGGTAFHFCNAPAAAPEFDYLFVDEAGQVSLANLVAMAACAGNIVLVGDQMQLPQPVQGVHPGETGLSCLDYLLQGRATVPPELGILLDTSWRMHPDLCALISEAVYDGRLKAHRSTIDRHLIDVGDLSSAGVTYLPVEHSGCRQASGEEVRVVADLVARLQRARIRESGSGRQITLDDILVVAPYNMQVNWLVSALPDGARIGTVDKFQGQEAAVVIVSMATSSSAEAPRGTEFLFNRNRLNVALSRAKCLAIVVAGSHLLDAEPGDAEDLVRLDFLARAESAAATHQ